MSDNNNNGKRNRIPRGYTADDTQRRLDWLKEEQGFDYHDLDEETRLADAEWDEHWQQFDMELLDSDGCFMDDEQERI